MITAATLFRSRGKRSLNGPSSGDPLSECFMSYAKASRPFSNGAHLSVQREEPIIVLVLVLLLLGGPPAVAWLVVAIFIGIAVYGVRGAWALPHIRKKSVETVRPAVANGYAATTIHWIGLVIAVGASTLHSGKNLVFVGASKAMTTISRRIQFVSKASAAFGFLGGQGPCKQVADVPAITSAFPITVSRVSNDRPSVDAQPDNVLDQFMHAIPLCNLFIYHICRGRV